MAKGCDTLVSIGGIQSNHTRQVTGVARHLGLGAVTVQEGWVDWPDTNYDSVGNIQLTRIMGGDIRIDPAGFDIGIRDSWRRALGRSKPMAGRPIRFPPAPRITLSAVWVLPIGRSRSPNKKRNGICSSTM